MEKERINKARMAVEAVNGWIKNLNKTNKEDKE